jgi:hypothetical protein
MIFGLLIMDWTYLRRSDPCNSPLRGAVHDPDGNEFWLQQNQEADRRPLLAEAV